MENKKVSLGMLMMEGLGYSERGWKSIKSSTLKKIGTENPSDVFYLDIAEANVFKENLTVGKDKIEILATINVEDYLTEVEKDEIKTRKKGERAGTLADRKEFISEQGLDEEFKKWLSDKYGK